MTNREAYVFGWVFGRLNAAAAPNSIGGDVALAPQRPFSASAKVVSDAQRLGILKGNLNDQVGEALSELDIIEPEMDGGSERCQPLGIQGSWLLGYFAGHAKKPLAEESFDISVARRAKKLTQAQLADQMGVDQALVSRWESGKVSPNKDNLAKLKEILL